VKNILAKAKLYIVQSCHEVVGEGWIERVEKTLRSVKPLYDIIIVDTFPYTLVPAYRVYNTKSKCQCKKQGLYTSCCTAIDD
jgi:hypothetical protein